MKYNVAVTVLAPISASVEVEALSEEEAAEKVREVVLNDDHIVEIVED